jgi:hypothetical protein
MLYCICFIVFFFIIMLNILVIIILLIQLITLITQGSPYAAGVYKRNGFVHLNGGLDKGTKGYNPDDLGEWIMIRQPSSISESSSSGGDTFDRDQFIATYYCHETDSKSYKVVQLKRCHWADLCLLFNLDETNNEKLLSRGISNGVQIEEKILSLINITCGDENANDTTITPPPMVCLDCKNERVHGFSVWDNENRELEVYTLPGMEVIQNILIDV